MSDFPQRERPMRFGLVLLGLLFFANPYFAVVDVLPDVIGCLLIYIGLGRAARINRQVAEARTAFFKLLCFDVIKQICVLVVFGMSTDLERPVSLLAIAFVGAVLGLYFSFAALGALFEGFHSLSITQDCPALYGALGHRLCRNERILRYSTAFFVAREVICLLPELSALTTSSYIDSDLIRIYDYIGVMRTLAFLLVLVASALWIVCLVRYFATVRCEREFCIRLSEAERAYTAAHPGNAVERRYTLAFAFLAVGGFLTADFYLDLQNIIPDAAAALCLLVGVLLTDLERRRKLICSAVLAAFGAAATLSAYFAYRFAMNHSPGEISKTEEAAGAYLRMWLSSLAEFLFFLAALVLLLLLLRRVIRKWAGYLPKHDDLEFEQRRRQAFVEDFDSKLIRTFLFGFVSALCSFIYDYMQEIPSHRVFRILEFFWALDLVMALVFGVMLAVLLSAIREEIKNRFRYES